MHQFIDGNGNDATAAALAYLKANRQIIEADLYLIGALEDPTNQMLTDFLDPLQWNPWGSFRASNITRSRTTSQYGFQVDQLDVMWRPPLTAFGLTGATANPYQKAQTGFYDNKKVLVWTTIMPTRGDANTYGAMERFGGYISESEVTRASIKFSVQSFLNVVNQKTPPNVIEASNTLSQYSGAVPVLADLEKNVPTFTVKAPSNTNIILGDTIQPTAHKIYANGRFVAGYMVFLAGSTLAGYYAPIAGNTNFSAGGGTHYNQFQIYGSLPFAPTPGDDFYVSTQLPTDYATATTLGPGFFKGFPFVPDPTSAI